MTLDPHFRPNVGRHLRWSPCYVSASTPYASGVRARVDSVCAAAPAGVAGYRWFAYVTTAEGMVLGYIDDRRATPRGLVRMLRSWGLDVTEV